MFLGRNLSNDTLFRIPDLCFLTENNLVGAQYGTSCTAAFLVTLLLRDIFSEVCLSAIQYNRKRKNQLTHALFCSYLTLFRRQKPAANHLISFNCNICVSVYALSFISSNQTCEKNCSDIFCAASHFANVAVWKGQRSFVAHRHCKTHFSFRSDILVTRR